METVSRRADSSSQDDEVDARLAAILDVVADAVLVVDSAGQVVSSNPAFDRLFGSDSVELDTLRKHAAGGVRFSTKLELDTPDGQRCFDARTRPIQSRDGELQGGVIVLTEDTDSRLLRLHEEFMALASHELRSPLTALGGFFEMISRRLAPELDARTAQHLTRGQAQVRRLFDLVNELTDLSRLHNGKLELRRRRFDLVPLLAQIVETGDALSEKHAVKLNAPSQAVWVNADGQRIEQVLMNLIGNAIKYAPDSDTIDVYLDVREDCATIEVQDHGPGIAEADRNSIFQRYYQARRTTSSQQAGLGLGLYIAREIMLAHGGDLELTASSADGSLFSARLPLTR